MNLPGLAPTSLFLSKPPSRRVFQPATLSRSTANGLPRDLSRSNDYPRPCSSNAPDPKEERSPDDSGMGRTEVPFALVFAAWWFVWQALMDAACGCG